MGEIAKNLLAGKGFTMAYLAPERPVAAFPPFESHFYAAVHYVFGFGPLASFVAIALRSLCSVAAAGVLYTLLRRELSERIAWYALLAVSFYPPFVYYTAVSPFLVRTPFSILVMVLAADALARFTRRPTLQRSAWVGLVFGFGTLVQSNLAFVGVGAGCWMAFVVWRSHRPRRPGRSLAVLAAMPLLVLAVTLPWSIRNYRTLGEPVFVRTGFGMLFWLGNNPMATGDLSQLGDVRREEFDVAAVRSLSPEVRDRLDDATEVERDRILMNEALTFVSEHPRDYLRLTLRRLELFLTGVPKSDRSGPMSVAVQGFALYSVALVLLAGLAVALRREPIIRLFAVVIVCLTALYALIEVGYNYYRMDVEPFCLVLALVTLDTLWKRWRDPEAV